MSLHDEIEKIDKELEKATKPEKEVKDDSTSKKDDDTKESEQENVVADGRDNKEQKSGNDRKQKDKPKTDSKDSKEAESDGEDKKPDDKEKEEEKIDNAAYAKLRRDQKAAEKRAEEADRRAAAAEAKLKEAPTQPQRGLPPAQTDADREPDANLDPEAHLRWELAQTRETVKSLKEREEKREATERQNNLKQGAIKAFEKYENDFSPTVNDYQAVTTHGLNQIASSIRTLNPQLKGEDLQEAVRRQVLRLAAIAEQQGYDPAEHFYEQSKSWGYQEPKPEVKQDEPEQKTSVKRMAEHKKKTAGSLSHGGKSGNAPLSREAFKNMGFADFAKLTPRELQELESLEA